MKRFESVPNFSEGRDPAKVERIAAAARAVPGVTVLDVELNADHHRSVISLVGEGEPLVAALLAMARVAVETIDLNRHTGEHPRMGAVDVIPFVPLDEASVEDAVALSVRLAERLWKELQLPVYLYGQSARRPERSDLAHLRRGGFEGIREAIASDPSRAPDVGEPRVHPTAGIVAVGARPVLIAYNAYLTTGDVEVAKKVARAVRARDGGLAEVKALGFDIRERARAQVSMNLTDYHKTPLHRALEAVRREAGRYGVGLEESEIVGLVPEEALFDAAEFYLQLNRFDRGQILERKVRAASAPRPGLSGTSLADFAGRLAARTPTPGGGSASAAAGAFGAALGAMALAFSVKAGEHDPAIDPTLADLERTRARLLELVDEDTQAYEGLRSARRALKETPGDAARADAYRRAVQRACDVPLETARLVRGAAERLVALRARVKPAIASDLATGIALLEAARQGAVSNVEVNLPDLASAGGDAAGVRAEVGRLGSVA